MRPPRTYSPHQSADLTADALRLLLTFSLFATTLSAQTVISPIELYIGPGDTHQFTGGTSYESDPLTPLNGSALNSTGLFQSPATLSAPFDVRVRAISGGIPSAWATIHVASLVVNGDFEAPGGGVDHPPPYTTDQFCHPGTPTLYAGVPFWCHTGDGGKAASGGSNTAFGRATGPTNLVEQTTTQPLLSGWTYELRSEMWGNLPTSEMRLQLYDGATALGSPVSYTGDVLHTLRTFTYTATASGASSGVTIRLTGLPGTYTMFDNVFLKRWRIPIDNPSAPVISPAELYIGPADTHLFTGGVTYEPDPTTPLNGATLNASSGQFQTPASLTAPFDVRVRALNNGLTSAWATVHVASLVVNGNYEAPGGGVDHPPPYTTDQFCHPGTPTIYAGVPFWCHTGDGGKGASGGSSVAFGRASGPTNLVEQQTTQPLVSGWTYELRSEVWGNLPTSEMRLQLYDGATALGSPVSYTGDVLHTLRTFTYAATANGTSSGVTIRLTGLPGTYTMFDNVFLKRWRLPSAEAPPAPVTITFNTSPSGRTLTIDGVPCTNCVFQWMPGSFHTVAASSPQSAGPGTQYVLSGWTPGVTAEFTTPAAPAAYTAHFTTQFYLATIASTGGSLTPAPGWRAANETVTVTAFNNGGWFFSRYAGDLSGTAASQQLTMNSPKSVTATFLRPLVFTTPSTLPAVTAGSFYELFFSAAGGTPPYFFFPQSIPVGMHFDTTQGRLYGQPANTNQGFTMLVNVQDSGGQELSNQPVQLPVQSAGPALSVSCSAPATAAIYQNVTFTASASGGTPGYSFVWTANWSGFVPSYTSSLIHQFAFAGTYNASVTATDGSGHTRSAICSTQITGVSQGAPIHITTTTPLPPGFAGGAYGLQLQATGGTPSYTWSAVSALPPNVTLSPTGYLSSSSLVAGSYLFYVQAVDQGGRSTTAQLALSVTNAQVSLAYPQSGAGFPNVPHLFTFRFTSPQGPASITSGSMIFNTNTANPTQGQICQIEWTPSGSLNLPGIAYGAFGSGGSLSSSLCSVEADSAQLIQTAQGYDVSVKVSFTTQFPVGPIPIWARATFTSTGVGPWSPVGAWGQGSLIDGSVKTPHSSEAGAGPVRPYCGGGIEFGDTLTRYSDGSLFADIKARTFNLGQYPYWHNQASFIRIASSVRTDSWNETWQSENGEWAYVWMATPTHNTNLFRVIGDYEFWNDECDILLDPGSGGDDSGGVATFWNFDTEYERNFTSVDPTPRITSVIPSQVFVGTTDITINGSGFGLYFPSAANPSRLKVCNAGAATCDGSAVASVTVTSWTQSQILATFTATSPGQFELQVTSAGVTSSFQSGTGQTNPQSNRPSIVVAANISIEVRSNGVLIGPNGTALLDSAPAWPTITAQVFGAPPGVLAQFRMVVLFFQMNRQPGDFIGNPIFIPCLIIPHLRQYPPTGPLTPTLSWTAPTSGAPLFGGQAYIEWVIPGVAQGVFPFMIRGTNPAPPVGSDPMHPVISALNQVTVNGAPVWFAPNVANHESGFRQFFIAGEQVRDCHGQNPIAATPGMPKFGPPGGYGMMQVDPPTAAPPINNDSIWDWRKNIQDWEINKVRVFAGSETGAPSDATPRTAYRFWRFDVQRWQIANQTQSLPWVDHPSQNSYQNCAFSPPDLVTGTARTTTAPYWYGDAILMKALGAGYPTRTLAAPQPGAPIVPSRGFVEWDIATTPAIPFWRFNTSTGIDTNLVQEFCQSKP